MIASAFLLLLLASPSQGSALLPDRLTKPVPVTASQILVPASASLRAQQVAALPAPPVAPRSFVFQCSVDAVAGRVLECRNVTHGKVAKTRGGLRATDPGKAPDPIAAIAEARIHAMRLDPAALAPLVQPKRTLSMRFRETVAASDNPALGASQGTLTRADLITDPMPRWAGAVMKSYYPPAALRADVALAMVADCRVMADGTLLCRNARPAPLRPDLPADLVARVQSVVPGFVSGTYQALGMLRVRGTRSGAPATGRDVTMTIRWTIGED